MWLSDISIKRPVLATVMSLILVLLGAFCFFRLPVREYPDINPPVVSVNTFYQGASPETIEATITEPLEDELTSIEGIRTISSVSSEENSTIVIEFDLDRNIDVAAQDVRDRVARARQKLPTDVDDPIVTKQDADAQPIIWLGLSGNRYSRLQLSDYVEKYLKDPLQTLPGVSSIRIGGERQYSMRIWLDPLKMAARKVTPADIEDALNDKNVEIPAGRIESKNVEFTVKTQGELYTPEMFNNMIIKTVNDTPVYLKDVGYAKVGPEDDRTIVRLNGKPAVGIGVIKQSKANTLDVAHAVKEKLKYLQKQLPPGMTLEPAYDESLFIDRSIQEVKDSLIFAGFLVVVVIFLFLRNLRSALIPAVSIPISIIATFGVMYAFGFTINTFTLLALTLAIGLVVDDTIVVLENIARHIELGETPLQAAFKGTQEIGFAIMATTITLVAVFVPIGFMSGSTGKLFFEFAIAVAASVLISGFVSLTLSPMLCSKWLKSHQTPSLEEIQFKKPLIERLFHPLQHFFSNIPQYYKASLEWGLEHPKTIIFAGLLFVGLSVALLKVIPTDFLPTEDRGSILTVIKAPEGATMAYTDRAVRRAEAIINQRKEVAKNFSVIGFSPNGNGSVNQGIMFSSLKLWDKRKTKQQQIVAQIQPQMMQIPEAFVFPINPPSAPQFGFGGSIQMVLQGFDENELYNDAEQIIQKAQKIPGIVNLDTDVKLNKPQIDVHISRDRAEELGVTPKEISKALEILLGGLNITDFKLFNKRYKVMVRAEPQYRDIPSTIRSIMVKGNQDEMIPLANVVSYQETVSPNEINHYNRLRSVTISGSNIPFMLPLGTALNKLETIAHEVLPPNIEISYAGQSRELKDAGTAFYATFLFALVLIYLVLAAQFESFKHPFVILLTVPLAVCGALLALFFANASINVYSQIGMVLLIGLVTKNGILIVEYANQLQRDHGLPLNEAILQASLIRFRPIMMTTVATIFGAVPIAFALGAGSESRQSMGIAIVGGMMVSTILTLFVIPIAYKLINYKKSSHEALPIGDKY